MALVCKVARLCQTGSRGFCQKAEVVHEPGWSDLLASLEAHVTEPGKDLLPALKKTIPREIALEKKAVLAQVDVEKKILLEQITNQKGQIGNQKTQKKLLRASVTDLRRSVEILQELLTKERLETMRFEGLNNTLGLFEKMQEALSKGCNKALKGTALWEAVLTGNAPLATCVEKHTKMRAVDVVRQAVAIYNIYSVLSQHIHAGKELAELQAHKGGTILFHRGPLSPEQVSIYQCLGAAAGFNIAENPQTRPGM